MCVLVNVVVMLILALLLALMMPYCSGVRLCGVVVFMMRGSWPGAMGGGVGACGVSAMHFLVALRLSCNRDWGKVVVFEKVTESTRALEGTRKAWLTAKQITDVYKDSEVAQTIISRIKSDSPSERIICMCPKEMQ